MSEEFLHFIWQYKHYHACLLKTIEGEDVEVIHPGEPNSHAGPDFFNAKIKIGNTLWAGNVEVHISSSDWFMHEHHKDKSYDNVILHVVYIADEITCRTNGVPIPVCKLNFSDSLWGKYQELKDNRSWLLCADKLSQVGTFELRMWMQRMLIEKLEHKAGEIDRVLNGTVNDWDETFYRLLFRSFGFSVNGEPFEMLSQSLPLAILRKYADSPETVEALLFGQAGFLSYDQKDEYSTGLKKEYDFYKSKHSLRCIDNHLWKFLRLRPLNFPTIRISQLVNLLCKLQGRYDQFLKVKDLREVSELLDVEPSQYWQNHYRFGCNSKKAVKRLGQSSKNLIIINTIIPFLFTYARTNGDKELEEKSLGWLEFLKPEKNAILTEWKDNKICMKNAADSQALIYLSNNYCKKRKCLHCSIGHKVLTVNSV